MSTYIYEIHSTSTGRQSKIIFLLDSGHRNDKNSALFVHYIVTVKSYFQNKMVNRSTRWSYEMDGVNSLKGQVK